MPPDGYSDREPTTDPGPVSAGWATQASTGPTVEAAAGRSPLSAPPRTEPPPATRLQSGAARADATTRLDGPLTDTARTPPRPRTPLWPNRPAGQVPPPGKGAPPRAKRRRRWWLALIAALAVLVGGTAAVLAQRESSNTPASDAQGGPDPAPQGDGQPGSTPSGKSGLGPDGSRGPTSTPTPGSRTVPDPAPFIPGGRRTLPGATISLEGGESFTQALSRADRTFGPLRMVRVFYPGLPPRWEGSRSDAVNRTVVVSFKAHPREINAGRHDSQLAAWFASIPRQHDVYWAYFHEPENDVERGSFTPADFKAAWRRVANLANRAGNPRLINTVILMCFTVIPSSRRDFNAYYPGSDLVETLGWDCYNHATKTNGYNAPANIYARAINKSKQLGKPWGIAETGSTRIRGDSGSGRAAWLRSVATYLNNQRPLWVTYYNANRPGGDFRLTDGPSQQAWKAFCGAAG